MKKFCIFFISLGVITGIAFSQNDGAVPGLAAADSLYDRFEEGKALQAYREILEQHPDHYRALWRASFLYSRIGYRQENKSEQRAHFNQAIALAERALEVDSTDTQSNYVMSVAMGRKAMISGARQRVAAARDIKKYADRAIAYDSTNAGAWHVLGRWHHKVANLNFIERLAANALFGGIPDADEEQAGRAFKKAVDLAPEYILYRRDLAEWYSDTGEDPKAISVCRSALTLEVLTPDDSSNKADCRRLINGLQ